MVPGRKQDVLQGCGHDLVIEQPERAAAARRFWAGEPCARAKAQQVTSTPTRF